MAAPNTKKQIHTAGIIIIGDEVLGGKVRDSAQANVLCCEDAELC
jgi:hypothetical protein